MAELRLEELSAATIVAANSLTLRPGQEQFVAPTSYAIADAYINPLTSWPRVVLDGDKVVGEEWLLRDRHQRVRDVKQAPDGSLYVLTEAGDGALLRISRTRR